MKSYTTIFLGLLLVLSTEACSTWRKLNNTEKGAVIGTGAGAAIGSSVSPGVGGAVIGGAAGGLGGGLIGNEIDKDERRYR